MSDSKFIPWYSKCFWIVYLEVVVVTAGIANVKLSLYLIKHHATNEYGDVEETECLFSRKEKVLLLSGVELHLLGIIFHSIITTPTEMWQQTLMFSKFQQLDYILLPIQNNVNIHSLFNRLAPEFSFKF
jgi:hypothetical protein